MKFKSEYVCACHCVVNEFSVPIYFDTEKERDFHDREFITMNNRYESKYRLVSKACPDKYHVHSRLVVCNEKTYWQSVDRITQMEIGGII